MIYIYIHLSLSLSIYIYIYIYQRIHIYIYIYIVRKRVTRKADGKLTVLLVLLVLLILLILLGLLGLLVLLVLLVLTPLASLAGSWHEKLTLPVTNCVELLYKFAWFSLHQKERKLTKVTHFRLPISGPVMIDERMLPPQQSRTRSQPQDLHTSHVNRMMRIYLDLLLCISVCLVC